VHACRLRLNGAPVQHLRMRGLACQVVSSDEFWCAPTPPDADGQPDQQQQQPQQQQQRTQLHQQQQQQPLQHHQEQHKLDQRSRAPAQFDVAHGQAKTGPRAAAALLAGPLPDASPSRHQRKADQQLSRRPIGPAVAPRAPAALAIPSLGPVCRQELRQPEDGVETGSDSGSSSRARSSPIRRAALDARCRSFLAKLASQPPRAAAPTSSSHGTSADGLDAGKAEGVPAMFHASSRSDDEKSASPMMGLGARPEADLLARWRHQRHHTRCAVASAPAVRSHAAISSNARVGASGGSTGSSVQELAAAAEEGDDVVIAPEPVCSDLGAVRDTTAAWLGVQGQERQQWQRALGLEERSDTEDGSISSADELGAPGSRAAPSSGLGVAARGRPHQQASGQQRLRRAAPTAAPANTPGSGGASLRRPAISGPHTVTGSKGPVWGCSPARVVGALHLEEDSIIGGGACGASSAG
jgi:hypothetical protein